MQYKRLVFVKHLGLKLKDFLDPFDGIEKSRNH